MLKVNYVISVAAAGGSTTAQHYKVYKRKNLGLWDILTMQKKNYHHISLSAFSTEVIALCYRPTNTMKIISKMTATCDQYFNSLISVTILLLRITGKISSPWEISDCQMILTEDCNLTSCTEETSLQRKPTYSSSFPSFGCLSLPGFPTSNNSLNKWRESLVQEITKRTQC